MTSATISLRLRQIAFVPGGLALIAFLVVGNRLLRNRHIRYELTLEARTPYGVRRGSSVIQATIERSIPFWGDSGIHHKVTGNAPVVELPDGRFIFALLRGSGNVSLPELAAQDANVLPRVTDWRRRKPTHKIWSHLKAKRPTINVDAQTMLRRETRSAGARYPTIVVVDPGSAECVRRIDLANSEDVLGPGFSVTGLGLRFVNTPPDTKSEPPWLSAVSRALDDHGLSPIPRPSVTWANFIARRAG